MKKIIIVRHAKSSWEYDVIDHDRPLNNRGKKDAILVSKYLNTYSVNPDLILSSDALRARKTGEIFLENLNLEVDEIKLIHDLYDFSGYNLLEIIKSTDDSVDLLMVFGHNHAITAFVNSYGDKHIENVPTSGVVIIEVDISAWKNLKQGTTTLTIFPRDLKQ